ncbi:MAG: ATP-binding protein [Candidatus Hodarchaeota archaeon]
MDRLLHHSHIIPINGPSYRTKDRVKADKVVKENQTY